MQTYKYSNTPFETSIKYTSIRSSIIIEKEQMKSISFPQAIGSLMYLATNTKRDLAYHVSHLDQFMSNPRVIYWTILKCILSHIQNTKEGGILYTRSTSFPQSIQL